MVANDIIITRWPHSFFFFLGLFNTTIKNCNGHAGNLRKGCCEWLRAHFCFQAPSKQVMHFWLQQLQQKRWEYSNTRGQRDSWSSPTLPYPLTGLVGKDNGRQVHTLIPAGNISCIFVGIWIRLSYILLTSDNYSQSAFVDSEVLFVVFIPWFTSFNSFMFFLLSDMQNSKALSILNGEKQRRGGECLFKKSLWLLAVLR